MLNADNIYGQFKRKFFEDSFFPAALTEWNVLDYFLRNVPSINVFKQNIFEFIRLCPNKVVSVKNFVRTKANKLKNILLENIVGRNIAQKII